VGVSGDIAVVGAPFRTVGANSSQGAVYIFMRNGSTWSAQPMITSSDGAASDDFGLHVAINGNTAVIGAPYKNGSQGAAYVFTYNGSAWSQQQKLTASDGAANDIFGCSVAVNGDTAVVGADQKTVSSNPFQGAAYVFTRSGTTWSQQQKLTGSDGAAGDQFGDSVSTVIPL